MFRVDITTTVPSTTPSTSHQKRGPGVSVPDRARVVSVSSSVVRHTPPKPEHPQALRGQALIRALYAHGLLRPGDALVWNRPMAGTSHKAVLTSDCRLRLEGHAREFSPSGAALALTGGSHDGLKVWRTADGGVSLKELRERLSRSTA
ncbi:restriction system modified-DNA reader domain-containing protein [Nocardiopsis deserti]|uniref:restriction system modified-DNA reader domain-containing protein n=1 Tax=Nocardiopsis deserti TaxID=2605988 RepID=UPI001CC2654C|nr:hypothetical protein [Nocardiopsis deserti]